MIRFAKKKERGEELGRVGEVLQISPYSPIPCFRLLQKEIAMSKANYLSFGRRMTLIKVTLFNLPVYYLSLFKIPKGVAADIERLKNKFLWRSQQD